MFKKIRFSLLYLGYWIKKNYLYLLFGLIIGIIVFLEQNLIFKYISQITQKPDIIGLEGLYTFDKLPTNISEKISYGLTTADKKGKLLISPIVESLDTSNNNLTYTFSLKKNLLWHNQKKLVSHDIKLDIPGTNIKFISDYQLEINFKKPFSPALSLFDQPLFLNNSAYGLGEYKVDNITYQDGYIKTLTITHLETKQKIIYKFYSNEKDLFNAFKLGQVNQIVSTSLPSDIESWPKLKITKNIDTSQYIALFFDTEKISSKQTRQALAYATKKNPDKNIRCVSPISPSSWAYNPEVKEYNFSVIRSKDLYDKNKLESISILVTNRKLLDMAENIKKDWKENLNLNVNINASNDPKNNQYDAILSFGQIPIDPDQYNFWHSTQTQTNITKLNNSRIDKLLEEGRQVFDPIERKKIYFDFQRYLLEESPTIFLEFPTIYTISKTTN